jgi:hypothetical protein
MLDSRARLCLPPAPFSLESPASALSCRAMVARRHHYIPKFYLKGFAVARKRSRQLIVFDKESCTTFPAATDNVAVEMDFNRVEIEGYPPDVVEKEMSKFETEAAAALERIVAAKSIRQTEDRSYLLNLIGLLAVRNPRHRERWRDFQERIAKRIMSLATATPERWASQVARAQAAGYMSKDADTDYTKLRKFLKEEQYKIRVGTESHIRNELEAHEAILPYLFKRKWALLKCESNSGGFVTSDHPVCLYPKKRGLRAGHKTPETEIVFPICSRLAMVGAFEIEDHEIDAPEELVAAVNGTVIQFAGGRVFARDYNFRYTLESGELPKKASRLIGDIRLRRKDED